MSILILNFVSPKLSPYEEFLLNSGEELILLAAEEYSQGFDEDKYVYIETFRNYRNNNLIELRAIELYEKYKYHTIIANAEADIIRAAKLREYLNLDGQKLDSALQYRDKVLMKQIAAKHGIPTPPCTAINDAFDLFHFIEHHGLPIVLKPKNGVGSRDTFVIRNQQELNELLYEGVPEQYTAEKFVTGDVCHVDGIVQNGSVVFICASKYLTEPIKYQHKGYLGSYLLEPTNPLAKRLCKVTEKLISVLQTPPNTTFHAEWFHTPNNEIILCEIASRTGGGKIVNNIYQGFGIQLMEAFTKTQCAVPYPLPDDKTQVTSNRLTGWVKIPPKQGIFLSAPLTAPPAWVKEYELLAQPGKSYSTPNGVREYIAAFVVEGDSELEVYERLINIADWFHQTSSWQDSDLIAT